MLSKHNDFRPTVLAQGMHDLNQVLERWRSGSQYKHGFCSNSRQYGSRVDFFLSTERWCQFSDELLSLDLLCQLGLVSVSFFVTCSFDMFKYIFWVSLWSVWLIFAECTMWLCSEHNLQLDNKELKHCCFVNLPFSPFTPYEWFWESTLVCSADV